MNLVTPMRINVSPWLYIAIVSFNPPPKSNAAVKPVCTQPSLHLMFPVTRSSRICLFCTHHSSTLRLYASVAATRNSTTKTKKSTALKGKEPTDSNDDATSLRAPRRTPYRSRIEEFLQDLDASPKAPTLEDLSSMKMGTPAGPKSSNYSQEYDAALKKVMRAFRSPQLIQLANQLGYDDKLPQNQREIAQILLEKSWDWPLPHVVERKRREQAEVLTKDIAVEPSLVVLLLSEEIYAIPELGRRFGLVITLVTVEGTVFQVQGHLEGISKLESYLQLRERELLTMTMDLDGSDTPSISILRLAGRQSQTYIEASTKGDQLNFIGFTEEALQKSKRMIQRYLVKSSLNARTPVLWHVSSQTSEASIPVTSEYGFLPFLAPNPPTWYLSDQRLFRLKKVVEWLEESDASTTDSLSEGLFLDQNALAVDLGQSLPSLRNSPQPGYNRSCIASVGHLVFSRQDSKAMTLLPGKWSLETMISHVKDTRLSSGFLPSLPSPLLSSPPSSIATVHRAVYRQKVDTNVPSRRATTIHLPPSNIFLLEVAMEHTVASPELDDLDGQDVEAELILIRPLDGPTRCQVGREETLDVLFPERPMDIRLTVRDLQSVPQQEEPEVLKIYLQELLCFLNFTIDQQPPTPELIEYEGIQYILDTSSSVRRTEEYFSPQRSQWEASASEGLGAGIEATSETSLDLESKEKISECLIRTSNCATDKEFEEFMARCATITSMPFSSLTQASEERVPYFVE